LDEPTFAVRASLASRETTYRLTGEALEWASDKGHGRLPLAEIAQVRLYAMPKTTMPLLGGATLTPGFQQCVVTARRGPGLKLVSSHFLGVGAFEDRSAAFQPFVRSLVAHTAAANPRARFVQGAPSAVWSLWLGAMIVCLLCGAFGLAVMVEGFRLGIATHWVDVLLGGLFVAVCGVNARSMWRLVVRARGRRVTPEALA